MPSEKAFLLGGYDYNDLFGKRKNTTHSPHIRSQVDMDTNLCIFFFGITLFTLFVEAGRTQKYLTLRDNMVDSDKGRFKAEDFN